MSKQTESLKLARDFISAEWGFGGTTDIEPSKLVRMLDEALAEQPAQGCEFCSHPLYAGTKCKNCGKPAQQQEIPKIGCVNHDCDKCKKAQQEPVRVPVTDNTYNYAKSLAEAIFKQHFASDEHYSSGRIVWGVNDTVIGILTQIDNMVADMVRRPAQQEPSMAYKVKMCPRQECASAAKCMSVACSSRAYIKPEQPAQQHIEHCIWARNGNAPCPHVQPATGDDK